MSASDICAVCGHPRHEHSYNGACYGVCGSFVPPALDLEQELRERAQFADDIEARAADKIERLQDLVRTLLDNDPNAVIADGGETVLDAWRQRAQKVLG